MRLLNTQTLRLEEFFEADLPPYAILSHTWEKEEVLLPDMVDLAKARQKASPAAPKLSEAINSMYRWYQRSRVCYAYLCDVVLGEDLSKSRWFTRGWTLQELIAPSNVEFYSGAWGLIGTKDDEAIVDAVSRVTDIDPGILSGSLALSTVSMAQKMYWASKRVMTRPEDEAYCLIGLFDINIPLIYGEGRRAVRRLQEIMSKYPYDQSILAWMELSVFLFTMSTSDDGSGIQRLNTCCYGQYLQPWPPADVAPSYLSKDVAVAILDCQLGPMPGTDPTLLLRRSGNGAYSRFMSTGQEAVKFSLHDSASLTTNDRPMLGLSPAHASLERPLLFKTQLSD
ncbi:hypothetical protein B0T22DRAFT_485657 [Podospora appendiculata]|uniref:Heterokaryon incompatibility domain-containing protein n=1 Tax=Podospora appendiculata TaxID=314037 RepID=A0AAE0WZ17_9PEZI|nr:hypothetical protein B0T22DRAFT_485657 [Podospora appendiculata]